MLRPFFTITYCLSFILCNAQSEYSYEAICSTYLGHSEIDAHIGIIDSGKIIFQQAYGYASNSRFRNDSLAAYPIGSISKTYTAVLVLKAIQNKRFDLNTSIDRWIDDMPLSKEITVGSLLYHSSGLSDKNYFRWRYESKKLKTIKGSNYANCNYGILGLILEKEYQRSLSQIFHDSLFDPLRLENTFSDSIAMDHAPDSIMSKSDWQSALKDAGGAGNLTATCSDVLRFYHRLYGDYFLDSTRLSLLRTFHQGYGPGTFPAPYKSALGITNSGQFGKYRSTVIYFPDQQFGIAILSSHVDTQAIDSLLLEIVKNKMD